jgi:hypothetical protein
VGFQISVSKVNIHFCNSQQWMIFLNPGQTRCVGRLKIKGSLVYSRNFKFRKHPFSAKRGLDPKGSLTWRRVRGVPDFSIKGGRNTFAEQQCAGFLGSELTPMCCVDLGKANNLFQTRKLVYAKTVLATIIRNWQTGH